MRGAAITDVLSMRRPWVLLLVALMLAVGCGPPRTGRTAAPVATNRDSSDSAVDPLLDPLLDLLAQRFEVTTLVARAKWNAKFPVEDVAREQALLADLRGRAGAHGLSGDWVETFFRAQIEAGKDLQRVLIARWTAAQAPPFADAPDLRGELRPRIDALNTAILAALGDLTPHLDRHAVQARLRERGPARLASPDISPELAARALAPLVRTPSQLAP